MSDAHRLDDGYVIKPMDDPSAVIDLWARDSVLPDDVAQERLAQVLLVAATADGSVAGVTSAFLQPAPQLRTSVWNHRVYVDPRHRGSNLMYHLIVDGFGVLQDRFASGEDVRAPGIVHVAENRSLVTYFDTAVWPFLQQHFIGANEHGEHVYVRWFDGALAPLP